MRQTKKERYSRSRDMLLHDLEQIFYGDFSIGTKVMFLRNEFMDKWTGTNQGKEYHKYIGCPYWSKNALDVYVNNKENKNKNVFKGLVHEHVIPRVEFEEKLIKCLEENDFKPLNEMIDAFAVGAIITKEEDTLLNRLKLTSRMPIGFYEENHPHYQKIWARYMETPIQMMKIQWDEKTILDIKQLRI